jgi:diacylglycerol kinase family enzyme
VPRRVDVGEVNGRIFLNNSSLGLYPDIVRDREKQQRRLGRGKWPAAVWATLAALRRYPFLSMRLTVNGKTLARRTPFVFIGNNRYTMEGLAIGERDHLDDGLLSLYVAQHPTRLGLLRFAVDALLGKLGSERDFDVLEADGFEIDTHHAHLHVATDGEVTQMATPLRYRVRPGALTVLVPGRQWTSTTNDNGKGSGQPCAHSFTSLTCISAASTRSCSARCANSSNASPRPWWWCRAT